MDPRLTPTNGRVAHVSLKGKVTAERYTEGTWRQVTSREDHWGNRQVGPHAHCAHFWHDWVFIPDLGENAVFQYRWDPTSRALAITRDPRTLPAERGGPREGSS